MSEETWLPNRPHVPVTLHVLASGIIASQIVLSEGYVSSPPAIAVVVAASIVACAVLSREGRGSVGNVVLVVGLASSLAIWDAGGLVRLMGTTADVLSSTAVSGLELVVTSDASLGERGYRCRARVERGKARGGEVWLTTDGKYGRGYRLRVVGRFEPGEGDWGEQSRRRGVCGDVRAIRVLEATPADGALGLVEGLRTCVTEKICPRSSASRAILAGSVCGDRDALSESGLDREFATCGVAHLVAVSGGHIVIVAALLGRLLSGTRLTPRARAGILLVATVAYVSFCGAAVSAIRSWLMSAVAFGSSVAGRRAHSLSAACVVALAMLFADPACSGDLGFLLSVVSVVGLCVLSPYFGYVLRVLAPTPRVPRWVTKGLSSRLSSAYGSMRDVLAATFVAQLVTAPLTCSTFSEISLVSPLSNIVLTPLFTALIGAGMLFALLSWCPLGGIPLLVCDCAGLAIAQALGWLSGLPYASAHVECGLVPASVLCVVLVVALLVTWPPVSRGGILRALGVVFTSAILILARWRYLAPARVCVLDVGQGDAILVQDGPSAVLVDTGPDESCVAELGRLHVVHLDAVILTHLHDDHYGGMADLAGTVPCDEVFLAEGVAENLPEEVSACVSDVAGGEVGELSLGDTVRVGGFSLEVVWPEAPVDGNENADSIELMLSYDSAGREMTGLLTGDAERGETGEAVADGRVGDVDFLKVGHHGSGVSLTRAEALALDPEVSVASAGEGNVYGHPKKECVDVLEDAGSTFLCTKDVGTVTLTPGRDGVDVLTERRAP